MQKICWLTMAWLEKVQEEKSKYGKKGPCTVTSSENGTPDWLSFVFYTHFQKEFLGNDISL